MRVESQIYMIFYFALLDKFIETEWEGETFTEQEKESENIWSLRAKDEKNRPKGEFIAVTKFDLDNYKYFFLRKVIILKDKPETVSVNNRSLCRGLEYIGVILPDTFKMSERLSEQKRVRLIADYLWNEFKKKYGKIEPDNHEVKIPNRIQKIVTFPDEISEFKICKELVESYMESIYVRRFYSEAWNLMSDLFQTQGAWCGSFELFKSSFYPIKSIVQLNTNDFVYSYRHIGCTLRFSEIRELYNLKMVLKMLKKPNLGRTYNGTNVLSDKFEFALKHLLNHSNKRNWNKRILELIDNEVLKNYDFQRLLWIFVPGIEKVNKMLPSPKLFEVSKEHKVVFIFENDRWLIDYISDFAPKDLSSFINLI